jgi:hypothetical protein
VYGAPFHKHQGSGRRGKRLRSNGHQCLLSSAAPYVAAAGHWFGYQDANPSESFRNATRVP